MNLSVVIFFFTVFAPYIFGIRSTSDQGTPDAVKPAKRAVSPEIFKDSKGKILNPQVMQPTADSMWKDAPQEAWQRLQSQVIAELEKMKLEPLMQSSPPTEDQHQKVADLAAASGLRKVMSLGDRPSRNLDLETRVSAAELLGEFKVMLQWKQGKSFMSDLFYNESINKQDPETKQIIAAYTRGAIRQIAQLLDHNILSLEYGETGIDGYETRLFRDASKLSNLTNLLGTCFQEFLDAKNYNFCIKLANLAMDLSKHLSHRRKQVSKRDVQDINPLDGKFVDLHSEISHLTKRILEIQQNIHQ